MNYDVLNFENYLKDNEKSQNTIRKYVRDLKQFYEWITNICMDEANCKGELCEPNCRSEHCEPVLNKYLLLEYKEYLNITYNKISTINSKISSLNSYLKYIGNARLMLRLVKYQQSLFENIEKSLTKHEFRKLYDTCKNNTRLKLILETITRTGIRVSELKFITYEAIKEGRAVVYNKGKNRVIIIPRNLCKILLKYFHGSKANSPIFTTRNDTPISRKQIWQMLKNLANKAGIPSEKVFPHNLRHLYAKEYYKQTKDIVKLSSILGHSLIETTRIYARETEEECRIDIENLDFFGK